VIGVLAADLPREAENVSAMLGLQSASWAPSPGGALRLAVEIPPGAAWTYWPERGLAMWIGRDHPHLPPRVRRCAEASPGIGPALDALAASGTWLQEGALKIAEEWTPIVPGPELMRFVVRYPGVGVALRGTWGDTRGHAVRGLLQDDGSVFTESELQAETWLLVIHGLADG
jgi:hypothetical protein